MTTTDPNETEPRTIPAAEMTADPASKDAWDAEFERRYAARERRAKIGALLEEYDDVLNDQANGSQVRPSVYFSHGHTPPSRVQDMARAAIDVARAYTESLREIRLELYALGIELEGGSRG